MEKVCRGPCGLTKALDDFYRHPQMADGHVNVCKVCQREANARARERRLADPDERERERDRIAAWRAANPEAWKAARDKARTNAKANGSDALRAERRRARTGGREISVVSLRAILERTGRVCGICARPIAENDTVHWDHIIPLARGGEHDEGNLQPSHKRCNEWKGDRLPEEIVGLTPPELGETDDWEQRRREAASKARSEAMKARMAAMTPEERAARGAKISAAKKGQKHPPGALTGGSRGPASPDAIAKRSEANRARWAARTPEEREAWRERCRKTKAGSPGNAANLAKGHTPEVRAKAIAASAEARRGTALPPEHKAAIAEGLKSAYASGVRRAGHTEETKAKISTTKKRKAFWKASRDWLMRKRPEAPAA